MTLSQKFARKFNNLPLSRKILAITFLSSLTTLFLLCSLSFLRERESYLERELSNLSALARILERNTVAALMFDDSRIAKQYVDSFQFLPDIASVCIYTKEGESFAYYSRNPESKSSPAPTQLGDYWENGSLFYGSEVISNEKVLGKILIELNQGTLNAQVWRILWTNFALFIGGLVITIALAFRLQKAITIPINELVEVTEEIAKDHTLNLKAVKRYDDEIGSLADSVNNLLETIRARDESLIRINTSLEQTVEKRTRDLNERNKSLRKAIDAAQAAARAKNDFLATTSHELRTPLNPIIGYVDRLLEKSSDLETNQELEIIKQSAELLLLLIDNILDFTRIERGDIRLQKNEVNLQKCYSDVIYLMQAEVQKKDLDLEFKFDLPDGYSADKAVKFESDEGRLKQIVFNLMANAIKFTDSGKITVTSRIQKFENDNGKLYVCVEDTGIGISKEDLEKLFKPFSQVDTGLNRQYSGMGLGLAISNSIVEAMGGVIGCRSIDGKGSAFWFEIPIILKGQADEVELTVKSFDHRVSTQLGQSILLVDDERVNRELGASMIRSLGYNVVCAKDGFEALDLSGKQDFSLILMDIRMPRLDGFSTAEAIRDREGNRPPTPIIALSAHITSEDEERCKSVGINDYLQKPLKIKELNEFLKKWLTAQPSHNRL